MPSAPRGTFRQLVIEGYEDQSRAKDSYLRALAVLRDSEGGDAKAGAIIAAMNEPVPLCLV